MENQNVKRNRSARPAKLRRFGRTCTAFFLVTMELAMILFFCSPYADASGKNGDATVTYYNWIRVKTGRQLQELVPYRYEGTPRCFIWLVSAPTGNYAYDQKTHAGEIWSIKPTTEYNTNSNDRTNYTDGRYSCIQYTDSTRKTVPAFKYLDYYSDSFYSPYTYGMPRIIWYGYGDKKDDDIYTFCLSPNSGNSSLFFFRGADAADHSNAMELSSGYADAVWEVYFKNDSKIGNLYLFGPTCDDSAGFIVRRSSGYNTILRIGDYSGENENVFLFANRTLFKTLDSFYIWVAQEETFTAFTKDATIASGQTWTCGVDSSGKGMNIVLQKGVTITIQKGATLIIDGTFLNHGKIENYGTLIIREGAAFCKLTWDRDSGAGKVTCYGPNYKKISGKSNATDGEGQLLIMRGARMAFFQGEGDLIMNGGDIWNMGFLGVADNLALNYGATVHNQGLMMLGYDFSLGMLKKSQFGVNSGTLAVTITNGIKYSTPSSARKPISATGDSKLAFKIINDGLMNIYWSNSSSGMNAAALRKHITGSTTRKDSGCHLREASNTTIRNLNDYTGK